MSMPCPLVLVSGRDPHVTDQHVRQTPKTSVVAHWADPTGFVAQKSSHLASYFSDSADDHGNQLMLLKKASQSPLGRGERL